MKAQIKKSGYLTPEMEDSSHYYIILKNEQEINRFEFKFSHSALRFQNYMIKARSNQSTFENHLKRSVSADPLVLIDKKRFLYVEELIDELLFVYIDKRRTKMGLINEKCKSLGSDSERFGGKSKRKVEFGDLSKRTEKKAKSKRRTRKFKTQIELITNIETSYFYVEEESECPSEEISNRVNEDVSMGILSERENSDSRKVMMSGLSLSNEGQSDLKKINQDTNKRISLQLKDVLEIQNLENYLKKENLELQAVQDFLEEVLISLSCQFEKIEVYTIKKILITIVDKFLVLLTEKLKEDVATRVELFIGLLKSNNETEKLLVKFGFRYSILTSTGEILLNLLKKCLFNQFSREIVKFLNQIDTNQSILMTISKHFYSQLNIILNQFSIFSGLKGFYFVTLELITRAHAIFLYQLKNIIVERSLVLDARTIFTLLRIFPNDFMELNRSFRENLGRRFYRFSEEKFSAKLVFEFYLSEVQTSVIKKFRQFLEEKVKITFKDSSMEEHNFVDILKELCGEMIGLFEIVPENIKLILGDFFFVEVLKEYIRFVLNSDKKTLKIKFDEQNNNLFEYIDRMQIPVKKSHLKKFLIHFKKYFASSKKFKTDWRLSQLIKVSGCTLSRLTVMELIKKKDYANLDFDKSSQSQQWGNILDKEQYVKKKIKRKMHHRWRVKHFWKIWALCTRFIIKLKRCKKKNKMKRDSQYAISAKSSNQTELDQSKWPDRPIESVTVPACFDSLKNTLFGMFIFRQDKMCCLNFDLPKEKSNLLYFVANLNKELFVPVNLVQEKRWLLLRLANIQNEKEGTDLLTGSQSPQTTHEAANLGGQIGSKNSEKTKGIYRFLRCSFCTYQISFN